jgi:hypothetical protein
MLNSSKLILNVVAKYSTNKSKISLSYDAEIGIDSALSFANNEMRKSPMSIENFLP